MLTTFHDFRGKAVVDAKGELVGRVHDLQFDPVDFSIKALVVKLERTAAERLGLRRFIGSPDLALKILHVHAVTDTVLLRETLDDLAHLPPEGAAETHAPS